MSRRPSGQDKISKLTQKLLIFVLRPKANAVNMNTRPSIEINNKAVSCIQNGQSKEALELLRIVLADLKDQFAASDNNLFPVSSSRCTVPVIDDFSSTPCVRPYTHVDSTFELSRTASYNSYEHGPDAMMEAVQARSSIRPVPVLDDILLQQSIAKEECALCIYDQALLVSLEEQDGEVITSVILYNMALVNHNRGIHRGRTSFLSKALRLYKMSLDILLKSDCRSHSIDILLLALFNNAAQIYSQLFDLEEMRQCLDCMREVLASDPQESSESDQLGVFFLNTIFYPGEEFTLAPAA